MKNIILYLIPALIWGSTWFAITFQVGDVDPIVSVSYRFLLAGLILLGYSKIRKLKLNYTLSEHGFILLQGLFLFGFNYWMVYLAEQTLTSGLVALVFSTMLFMNIFNSRIFLKNIIPWKVYGGAVLGLTGIVMIFYKDLLNFSFTDAASIALLQAVGAAYVASLGNIISARNQSAGLPVIQTNAIGMTYGALAMALVALLVGYEFSFSLEFSYSLSLIYLAVFGSVFAFGAYLSLIGRIGASRAGYVQLVVPIIALIISTLFENYTWTIAGMVGVVFIISGNFIVLERGKTKQAPLSNDG
ncbi:DMT family transporter [Gracilimonas sp. BCB1]|uniref:DMT family transporter n=1 Tax=Gracilimonas sp. BCB1 TaxID=3152362 RepID=UPI0032D9224E